MDRLVYLLVANVLGLIRAKAEVADGSNQRIYAEGYVAKKEISSGSAFVTFRSEARVIDNKATKPAQEEG